MARSNPDLVRGRDARFAGLLVPSLPILLLTGGLIAQGSLPFWPIYFAAVIGAMPGGGVAGAADSGDGAGCVDSFRSLAAFSKAFISRLMARRAWVRRLTLR